jgi:hypothetical protein
MSSRERLHRSGEKEDTSTWKMPSVKKSREKIKKKKKSRSKDQYDGESKTWLNILIIRLKVLVLLHNEII